MAQQVQPQVGVRGVAWWVVERDDDPHQLGADIAQVVDPLGRTEVGQGLVLAGGTKCRTREVGVQHARGLVHGGQSPTPGGAAGRRRGVSHGGEPTGGVVPAWGDHAPLGRR